MDWNYLKIFAVGAAAGSISEYRMFGKKTIGGVYGWGAMIIYFVHKMNWPLGISLLLIVLAIVILECLAGKISFLVKKEKMWNYGECFCDGYVHPLSTMYFAGMELILLGALEVLKRVKEPCWFCHELV